MSTSAKPSNADLALWAKTAAITFAAALGVSGGTNVVMLLTNNPLIREHRPTLTFRSAIWGDGVILPLVNCFIINAFRQWRPRLTGRTAVPSIVGGSLISLAFHIGQGRNGMVNWTMTRPWRWNALGYYHFIYMATQFTYMLLYTLQITGRWRAGGISSTQKRDLGIIAALMAAFAVLLATDYQE